MTNFYNELVPLAASVPDTGVVPDTVRSVYVRVLTLARIGNQYGVSFEGAHITTS